MNVSMLRAWNFNEREKNFLVIRTIFSQKVHLEFVGRGSRLTDNRRVMEELIERKIMSV